MDYLFEALAVWATLYVVMINYGYHLTLPWYSQSVHLNTGENFDRQWSRRARDGRLFIKTTNFIFGMCSIIIIALLLVVPFKEVEYTPNHLSVHHDIVQNITVVIMDGHIRKLDFFEKGWLLVENKNAARIVRYRPLLLPFYSDPSVIVDIPQPGPSDDGG